MPDITLEIAESNPIEISFDGCVNRVPTGGTSGQVATKASAADYDIVWTDPSAATLSYFIPAGENISSGRAVVIDGGDAFYFQPSNAAHVGRMAGISRTSATIGQSLEIRPLGIIEDAALTFAPDLTLWVSANGVITDSQSPAWLVLQKAGISLENDKMLIDFSVSILK